MQQHTRDSMATNNEQSLSQCTDVAIIPSPVSWTVPDPEFQASSPGFLDFLYDFDVNFLDTEEHEKAKVKECTEITATSKIPLSGTKQDGNNSPDLLYQAAIDSGLHLEPDLDLCPDDLEEAERLLEEAQSQEDSVTYGLSLSPTPPSSDSGFFSASDIETSPVAVVKTTQQTLPIAKATKETLFQCAKSPQKRTELAGKKSGEGKQAQKPEESYLELIALAILDSGTGRVLLADIYQYALDNNPYFANTKCAWRNSIRHNLSVNECFVKAGRARNGRGFYWAIHPACQDAFRKGEFSRRQARAAVQKSQRLQHCVAQMPQAEGSCETTSRRLTTYSSDTASYASHSQRRAPSTHTNNYHPYRRVTTLPATPSAGYPTFYPSCHYHDNYGQRPYPGTQAFYPQNTAVHNVYYQDYTYQADHLQSVSYHTGSAQRCHSNTGSGPECYQHAPRLTSQPYIL